jgi:hypothetical protein
MGMLALFFSGANGFYRVVFPVIYSAAISLYRLTAQVAGESIPERYA